MAKPRKPVVKGKGEVQQRCRLHNISSTVWKNGENVSCQLQKGFKRQGDDEWTNVNVTFFPYEIKAAILHYRKGLDKMEYMGFVSADEVVVTE